MLSYFLFYLIVKHIYLWWRFYKSIAMQMNKLWGHSTHENVLVIVKNLLTLTF